MATAIIDMKNQKLVSIIITTKNEASNIERLLKSIQKQSYKFLEVIVVDNNSADSTKKIAEQFTQKVYDFGPERSAQRNYGAMKSKGNYLFFLDADMELTAGVVKGCVEAMFKDTFLAGLSIAEKSVVTSFWEKIKGYERSFYNESGDVVTDAARFFKRSVFERIGGYDETITGPEDWDLSATLRSKDYKLGWVPNLIFHYEKAPSLFFLFRKKFYYGLRAHKYLSKQKVSTLSPQTIYFLRPVFYKQWKKILTHPILSLSMFLMLFVELTGGGLGYLTGKVKKI